MIMNDGHNELALKLGLSAIDLFKTELELINNLVKRNTKVQLKIDKERKKFEQLYSKVREVAAVVDGTLSVRSKAPVPSS